MDFLIAGNRIRFHFYYLDGMVDSEYRTAKLTETAPVKEYLDNRIWKIEAEEEISSLNQCITEIHILPLDVLPDVGGDLVWKTDTCTIRKSGEAYLRIYHDGVIHKPYAIYANCPEKGIEVYCKRDWLDSVVNTNYLFNLCALEDILMSHGKLIFHCCFVEINGKATLFSGFSGIGKSTQGALWEKYRGARVINGDRCVIGFEDGIWYAYGFPFSGTSGICKNGRLPIDRIVFLKQARENCVRKVPVLQAGQLVWQQMMVNQWNPKFVDVSLDCINRMVEELPIYELFCTPDEAAIRCLESIM